MSTSPAARARVATCAARRPAGPRAARPGLASEFPKIRTPFQVRLAPRSSDVSVGRRPPPPPPPRPLAPARPRAPGRVSVKLNRLNKTARLPNGMFVHYVSPPDVQFLYDEIYENAELPQARTRHRAGRRRHRRRRQHRPVRDVRRAEVSSGARVHARTPAPTYTNLRLQRSRKPRRRESRPASDPATRTTSYHSPISSGSVYSCAMKMVTQRRRRTVPPPGR